MAMTAIKGRGPIYDTRPSRTSVWAPLASTLNFGRNIGQGACAGLLTYLGALHFTGGMGPEALAAAQSGGPAALRAVVQNFEASGFAAPVEIVAATALFLSAGRGPARLLGLFGFVAFAVAYANDIGRAEALQAVLDGLDAVRAFLAQFQQQAA